MATATAPHPPRFTPPHRNSHGERPESFNRALRFSVGGHALLLLAVIISSLVFRGKPRTYLPSVRVDLIGLPDLKKADLMNAQSADMEKLKKTLEQMEKQEKDQAKKKPKPVVEAEPPKQDDTMALKKKEKQKQKAAEDERKKKLDSAIARMKAIQAMEDSVKAAQAPAKGNKLSKGSQLFGEQKEGDTDLYVDALVTKVRAHWRLPLWLAKQRHGAKVLVFLNRIGRVDRLIFTQTSGNEQFDQYVRAAIEQAAPFDAPPSDIQSDGILLGFPL